MAATHYLFAAAIALAMTSYHVMGQTSTAAQQCTQQIQAILKTCSNNNGINEANFLWFTTNGTSKNGQAPADETAFRDQICQVEINIGQCVLTQAGPLFNTTCQSSPQIAQSVDSLFFTYDAKCAHPCRGTLINEMTACYTQAGLSTDLFLSNRTRGHVIGDNEADVTKFCDAKDSLLTCLKPKVEACPESLAILSSQEFHMPSYEQVINILCKHPLVYITGLNCFEEPTPAVEACVQKHTQEYIQTAINAQQQEWTPDRYIAETCLINIDQIKCDLEAWADKKHDACKPAVIGLRREMECKLLPPNCTATQGAKFRQECNDGKYMMNDRNTFNQGGSGGSGGGDGAASQTLPLSVFALVMMVALVFFL